MMQPEPMAKLTKAGSPDVAAAMDRISDLPDGLIHTVMSFLPAPEVVRTCVLSRRWRNLWRSASYINIDEQDFGISMITSHDDALEKWARFEDFATNLLLFRDNNSPVGEFRLSSRACKQRHVDRWILCGIKYCPSVLTILILQYPRIKLPPVVASNFCHLKKLHLDKVDLGSHFTGLLSFACPVMEDLELQSCEFSGNSSQGITSPTLQNLVLVFCWNNTGYPLAITVPCLVYFCLVYGCYGAGISCKMDSLVRAKIYVSENNTLPQQNQRELLCSLHNVTDLELQGFGVEVMLNEDSDKFPIFRNIRMLQLNGCFLDEYDLNDKLEALGSFLQNTLCLEKLILDYCMFAWGSDCEWEIERNTITLQRQSRETLQCHQLKLIEVWYEHDHDQQFIELLWWFGRSIPDAVIKLTKM